MSPAYYYLQPNKDIWQKDDEVPSMEKIGWEQCPDSYIGTMVYATGLRGRRPVSGLLSEIFPSATPIRDLNERETPNPNPHYAGYRIDDFIAAERLNFRRGNVVKYICRAGNKPGESELKELKKAFDYLEREIKMLESQNE